MAVSPHAGVSAASVLTHLAELVTVRYAGAGLP